MANADPPKADSPAGRDADPVAAAERVPMSEEEQEIEQWLSRVPDEPGGLLREKLRRRYAEKRRGYGARQGGPTW
jgi:Ca-activated chloride channel family protein